LTYTNEYDIITTKNDYYTILNKKGEMKK